MSEKRTLLYFAPHQDDELLTMGVDVATSVRQGHDVHVILCSDGSKSGVRKTLCNGKTCSKHAGVHEYDLTPEDFIAARDREFTDSCLALGVQPDHIHIPDDRGVDGSVTAEQTEQIMKRYVADCREMPILCTISPDNGPKQHGDHKAVGQAANSLYKQGLVKEIRFFVEPYHYDQIADNPRAIPVAPIFRKASPPVAGKVKRAIGAYSYWNPEQQRYAVGYHSVTNEFKDFLKHKQSILFVKKSEKNMSRRERWAYRNRKWRKLRQQKQLYYSLPGCEQPELGALQAVSVTDEADYRAFCAAHSIPCTDKNCKRIADGSAYWALALADGTVVSDGWLAYKQRFYIGECDFGFDMCHSPAAILFDFNTKPEHRGNGYYGLLLRAMMSGTEGPTRYIIYTSPDNTSSSKGILRAGFVYEGTLCAADGSFMRYLKQAGFTDITRKYRLFGLKVTD